MDQEIDLNEIMSLFSTPPGIEAEIGMSVNVKTLINNVLDSVQMDLKIYSYILTSENESHSQLKIRLITNFLVDLTRRYFEDSLFVDINSSDLRSWYDDQGNPIIKNTLIHIPGTLTPEMVGSLFVSKINYMLDDYFRISDIEYLQNNNGVSIGYSIDEDSWRNLLSEVPEDIDSFWWEEDSNIVGYKFDWMKEDCDEIEFVSKTNIEELEMLISYLENGNKFSNEIVSDAMNGGFLYKAVVNEYFENSNSNTVSFK